MKTFSIIVGLIALGLSTYTGLALGGIAPPPYKFFGGWLGCLSPTFLAAVGTLAIIGALLHKDASDWEEPDDIV